MVMKSLDIPILTFFFGLTNVELGLTYVGIYSVADTASSVLFSMTAFALPIIASVSEAWAKKDWVEMEPDLQALITYIENNKGEE